MDIALIPCATRPEMLHHCLERIKLCKDRPKVLFHVDFKHDKDIFTVIESYPFEKEVIVNSRHAWNKLPVNILRGYREAVNRTDDLVYMIEDDVMISTDFFNWHKKVHEVEKEIFCSIGSRNNNHDRSLDLEQDPSKYYKSHLTYQSLGVCFQKEILIDYVLPHANDSYYSNNQKYCPENYPASQLGNQWCEQAGLIRRIQEYNRFPIVYPFLPRAYHAGFYGKNRRGRITGHIRKKIVKVGNIIFSKEAMQANSMNGGYYDDSMPIELNQQLVENIVLDNIKKL